MSWEDSSRLVDGYNNGARGQEGKGGEMIFMPNPHFGEQGHKRNHTLFELKLVEQK